MQSLFNHNNNIPLPERMRPQTLDQIAGQRHLLGAGGVLRRIAEGGHPTSLLFWGPPGVGKTTLARIIAGGWGLPFLQLSAVESGVKDVRAVIDQARKAGQVVLFLDEIHRFNKSQQDSLLGAVESGTIVLIGATTENPSFEVIGALLSRCRLFVLQNLEADELKAVAERALREDEQLRGQGITVAEWEALLHASGGDARRLLSVLELAALSLDAGKTTITNATVQNAVQQNAARYDKTGEQHYDIISAFIKSLRGSDPNGALYWMARMIAGGEEPKFIARRMVILASEDIGNANPNALLMATTAFQAVSLIGWPESRIILSQCAAYLASSPKSNASYVAINEAQALVEKTGDLDVPLHLRNAPTKLMKDMGYSGGYQYAHDFPGNFVQQEFLPAGMEGTALYRPGSNAAEDRLRDYLRGCWDGKYGY